MSAAPLSITIEPMVSYPREAEAGRTYLMTVDLRFPVDKEPWPYDEEEHEIHCLIDSAPFFDNEELNEGVIVLHRFGGTYGPAMFLLTANDLDMEDPVGVIKLTLTNRQLMPLQVFKLDNVRVSRKSIASPDTIRIRKEAPVESIDASSEAPDERSHDDDDDDDGGWADLPEEDLGQGTESPPAPSIRLPQEIQLLRTLRPGKSSVLVAMAWSGDGESIAFLAGRSVLLLDAAGRWQDLAGLPFSDDAGDFPKCLVWSSDGKLAVADSRTISLFDARTGRHLRTLAPHDSRIADIQWSPGGRQLGVVSETGQVDLLDPGGGATESLRREGSPAPCLAWRVQGDYFVVGHANGQVLLWSTRRSVRRRQQSNRLPARPHEEESGWASSPRIYDGHKARVGHVAWSPRGVYFASASDDHTVRLWRVDEPADNFQIVFEGHTAAVARVAFSADGELLVSLGFDGTARIWQVPQGRCVAIIDTTGAMNAEPAAPLGILAFHPQKPVLALCLESENAISTLELDVPALLNRSTPAEAAGKKPTRVSILYDRNAEPDATLAREISARLNHPDTGIFVDEGNFSRSQYLIVLLSGRSVFNDLIRSGVQSAFGYLKFLPVRVAYREPLPPPLAGYLNAIQWAHWETPSDTPKLLQELNRAISGSEPRDAAPSTGDRPRVRVFFAYKRNVEPDEPMTREIADALSRRHDVFIDQKIPVGVDWTVTINEAFGQAEVLVVMLTASSLQSRAVGVYLQQAAKRQDNFRIIPVRLAYHDALPEEYSFMNGMRQIVWRNPEDTPRVIEELTSIIEDPDTYGTEPPPLRGIVPPNSKFYIRRLADKRAEKMIRGNGAMISILGPHQVGKTSLLRRIGNVAQEQGARIVSLDVPYMALTDTLEGFLHPFCLAIAEAVGQADLFRRQWPAATDFNSDNVSSLSTSVMERVLDQSRIPVLLLADELDAIRRWPFYPRVLALMQTWRERGSSSAAWKEFSMIFTFASRAAMSFGGGVRVDFGEVIEPEDFTPEESEQLNQSHGDPLNSTDVLRLYELLRGHPYLTQQALFWLKTRRSSLDELLTQAANLEGPFGEHLGRLHTALYSGEGRDQKIPRDGFFQLLHGNGRIDPAALDELELLGLVRLRGESAEIRCRLYEEFFGKGRQA